MHVNFHFIMLFTFNSYILSKTIVLRIHVPYNQNLIEILQTFPQQCAGHHLVIDKNGILLLKNAMHLVIKLLRH